MSTHRELTLSGSCSATLIDDNAHYKSDGDPPIWDNSKMVGVFLEAFHAKAQICGGAGGIWIKGPVNRFGISTSYLAVSEDPSSTGRFLRGGTVTFTIAAGTIDMRPGIYFEDPNPAFTTADHPYPPNNLRQITGEYRAKWPVTADAKFVKINWSMHLHFGTWNDVTEEVDLTEETYESGSGGYSQIVIDMTDEDLYGGEYCFPQDGETGCPPFVKSGFFYTNDNNDIDDPEKVAYGTVSLTADVTPNVVHPDSWSDHHAGEFGAIEYQANAWDGYIFSDELGNAGSGSGSFYLVTPLQEQLDASASDVAGDAIAYDASIDVGETNEVAPLPNSVESDVELTYTSTGTYGGTESHPLSSMGAVLLTSDARDATGWHAKYESLPCRFVENTNYMPFRIGRIPTIVVEPFANSTWTLDSGTLVDHVLTGATNAYRNLTDDWKVIIDAGPATWATANAGGGDKGRASAYITNRGTYWNVKRRLDPSHDICNWSNHRWLKIVASADSPSTFDLIIHYRHAVVTLDSPLINSTVDITDSSITIPDIHIDSDDIYLDLAYWAKEASDPLSHISKIELANLDDAVEYTFVSISLVSGTAGSVGVVDEATPTWGYWTGIQYADDSCIAPIADGRLCMVNDSGLPVPFGIGYIDYENGDALGNPRAPDGSVTFAQLIEDFWAQGEGFTVQRFQEFPYSALSWDESDGDRNWALWLDAAWHEGDTGFESDICGWGENGTYHVGDGTSTTPRKTPVAIDLADVVQIADGGRHTLALKSDGTVWSWGSNIYGELGDNTETNRASPVQVKDSSGTGVLTDIVAVSAGGVSGGHSLALARDGTVWSWGNNDKGQLGINSTTKQKLPNKVLNIAGDGELSGIVAISAGGYHSIALTDTGTVVAWGENANGECGCGTTSAGKKIPVATVSVENAIRIGTGERQGYAVKSDHTLYVWGYGGNGQLGRDSTSNISTPVLMYNSDKSGPLSNVRQAVGGSNHTLILLNDGTVWACGYQYSHYQLGDNTNTQRKLPVQVHGPGDIGFLNSIKQVCCGRYHSMALKSDGTVWMWGYNYYRQTGDGVDTATARPVPVQTVDIPTTGHLTGIILISSGYDTSHALRATVTEGQDVGAGISTACVKLNGIKIDNPYHCHIQALQTYYATVRGIAWDATLTPPWPVASQAITIRYRSDTDNDGIPDAGPTVETSSPTTDANGAFSYPAIRPAGWGRVEASIDDPIENYPLRTDYDVSGGGFTAGYGTVANRGLLFFNVEGEAVVAVPISLSLDATPFGHTRIVYADGSPGSAIYLNRYHKLDTTAESIDLNLSGHSPDIECLEDGTHIVVYSDGTDLILKHISDEGEVINTMTSPGSGKMCSILSDPSGIIWVGFCTVDTGTGDLKIYKTQDGDAASVWDSSVTIVSSVPAQIPQLTGDASELQCWYRDSSDDIQMKKSLDCGATWA